MILIDQILNGITKYLSESSDTINGEIYDRIKNWLTAILNKPITINKTTAIINYMKVTSC